MEKKNQDVIRFSEIREELIRDLQKAKQENSRRRVLRRVLKAKSNPDLLNPDEPLCWMCWLDITGQNLRDFRRKPYSEIIPHKKICPLCGYSSWKGRAWYPLRYLIDYKGNPSSRNGMKDDY